MVKLFASYCQILINFTYYDYERIGNIYDIYVE